MSLEEIERKDVLDEALRDVIRPATLITGLTYAGIGVGHLFALADPVRWVLGGVELSVSAALLLLSFLSRKREFHGLEVQVRAVIPVLAVLLCNTVFHYFHRSPQPPFGLYLVAGALGVIAYSNRLFVAQMSLVAGLFVALVAISDAPLVDWAEHCVVMGAVVAVGIVAQLWRRNYVTRIADLRRDIALQLRLRETADGKLASAEERFRMITEHANDIIIEIDSKGELRYANPAATSVLGYVAEDLSGPIGRRVVLEEDGAVPLDDFRELLRTTDSSESVLVVRHRDGSQRWLEVSAQRYLKHVSVGDSDPVLSKTETHQERQRRWRVVLVARDVTRRMALDQELELHRTHLEELVKERTEALATSLRELQHRERLASIGTLTAGIAHQINNPVGLILASSQFALEVEGDDDQIDVWKQSLVENVSQAKRCGDIVRSMLQFARNEPTEKRREDLSAVVGNISCQAQRGIEADGGSFVFEPADVEIPIIASAIELDQVVLNLIANAVEASGGGADIKVVVDRIADVGRVFVSDAGRGIEQEVVERIFDPFFTTRLQTGGSGLGLSVAHGIVTDHGGTLVCQSAVAKGTTMIIEIPVASDTELRSS